MSFDYAEMAEVSIELITEFGQILIFKRKERSGEYDPVLGDYPEVEITWPGRAVVQVASKGTVEAFDQRFENGTLIESNLRSLLIAPDIATPPAPGDTVELGGHDWTLVGVTSENPAGTVLLYTGTIRR